MLLSLLSSVRRVPTVLINMSFAQLRVSLSLSLADYKDPVLRIRSTCRRRYHLIDLARPGNACMSLLLSSDLDLADAFTIDLAV